MLRVAFPVATSLSYSFWEVTRNGLVICVKPDCCSGEGDDTRRWWFRSFQFGLDGIPALFLGPSASKRLVGRFLGSDNRPMTARLRENGGSGLAGSAAEAILVRNRF